MFTAAEFRLIRERCPKKLDGLLEKLNIPKPDWEAGNEFRNYEALDEKIVNRLCRLMKSDSIINGYVKLLELGGIAVDYSETDNQLLNQIISHMNEINAGLGQHIRDSYRRKAAPLPPPVKAKDYGDVKIEFFRLTQGSFLSNNRKKLPVSPSIEETIKKMICDQLSSNFPYLVIDDIQISLEMHEGAYNTRPIQTPVYTPTPEPPTFDYRQLSEAIESLKLADDIVKTIG